MLSLKSNRNSFAPTELVRVWVPTNDPRCPLASVWTKAAPTGPAESRPCGPATNTGAQASASVLEYARCA